jgi:hypothetical protein
MASRRRSSETPRITLSTDHLKDETMRENEKLQSAKLMAEEIKRICSTNVRVLTQINTLVVENLKDPEHALLFLAEQERQIRLLSEALCRIV